MLRGILPIVFVPFYLNGEVDTGGLRQIVRFELDGGVHGIGINGFASEAYKLTDEERHKTVETVADEVSGAVPLIIGIAPGSTEAAIQQVKALAKYQPAAFMVLPPSTMQMPAKTLVEHYVTLGQASDIPIMVQQSPHVQQYHGTRLSALALAEIATRSTNVRYFKIEGPGSAERIAELHPLVSAERVALFGGGGGITLLAELRAGAAGLIPGVGFNEHFLKIWSHWEKGEVQQAEALIAEIQPLVTAISGSGHEFSLHARKYLMKRAGYIDYKKVRRPTVRVTEADMLNVSSIADALNLRISQDKHKH